MKNENKPHQNGPLKTEYGSIYGFNGNMIENPAIILDIPEEADDDSEIITLHKYGSAEAMQEIYKTMYARYANAGFDDMAKSLTLIEFNTLTGCADYDRFSGAKFSTDEICTFINYLNNCITIKQYKELFEGEETHIHERLAKLASFGF